MSDSPLVSVVIPAYNADLFIAEAIESVLSQTYSNWELIVVDDGSTDNTGEVVAGFGDRVRYFHKPRGGVSSARNYGARLASGKYLAFLDADDVWLPRKLEHQIDYSVHKPDAGLVYTGLHLVDETLRFIGRMDPPDPEDALRNTLLLERPYMCGAGTGLIRRDAFDSIGGFDERLSTSADCDFACRLACVLPLGVVRRPLLLYRCHSQQIHLDPEATEKDMTLVYEKLFEDDRLPQDLSRKENRAFANLYVSLAGTYLIAGRKREFFRYALRALARRPDRVLHAIKRLATPNAGVKRAA